MKKLILIAIAALLGFEEYRLSQIKPMVAPSRDVLPDIHDLVIPLATSDSSKTLSMQIDEITQSVNTRALQRILLIGNLATAQRVKDQLKGSSIHGYRIQTADGDLRKLIDPLTSMLTFSDSRNVLVCAQRGVLEPILLRAHEAQLDVIAIDSGEALTSNTITSTLVNWGLKWRAIVETL